MLGCWPLIVSRGIQHSQLFVVVRPMGRSWIDEVEGCMRAGIEGLFTSALGLVPPWAVGKVDLVTAWRRIGFEVRFPAKALVCPPCGWADQRVHDRLRRSWRHLDFFQLEAWLHADVPRVACTGCGKTSHAVACPGCAKARASPHCSRRWRWHCA